MGLQFVIQLDNHPGELAHVTRTLASRGIDIHHVSCVGAGPLACMFVTTGDDDVTRDVLRGLGHRFIEGRAVMVEVPDCPEGLAEVSERLDRGGVTITGMLPVGRKPGVVEMAFCVDDEARARDALGLTALELVGCPD
jgi:hypothetical protein